MFILVILAYALLAIYEFVPLYKQKLWRDFGVNAALGIFSLAVALLLSFDVKIPSPEQPIREFITSIFGK
jgi:hypothetical protein